METSSWIAIYLPLFVVFVIIIPAQRRIIHVVKLLKKRRGIKNVSNELIKNCIGKVCTISTGALGSNHNKVKIIEVVDNWIKVESKGKVDLINSDFIQNIKVLSQ